MRLATLTLVLAVGLSIGALSGCAGKSCGKDEASYCKSVKPGTVTTVNKMCIIETEDPVDPSVQPVVWKGQSFGLCCNGCRPKWNKLTDAQKDKAVAMCLEKARSIAP